MITYATFPQVTVLLELISDLLRVVGRGQVSEEEEAEQTINRQTALYSLKLLCHNIGSHHQEAFVPVLLQAVEVITVANEEKNVTASALLCIAEVVSTLKALAIPQLPRFVSHNFSCSNCQESTRTPPTCKSPVTTHICAGWCQPCCMCSWTGKTYWPMRHTCWVVSLLFSVLLTLFRTSLVHICKTPPHR